METIAENCVIPDCLGWTEADFSLMRLRMKSGQADHHELEIRTDNLKTLAALCHEYNIPFWLQGKTLLGVFRDGQLLIPDHDDDIGVPDRFYQRVCCELYPALQRAGFQAVRQSRAMISVIRNDRYIDICFFTVRHGKAGYGVKWFPERHFRHLDEVTYAGQRFTVPGDTETLLKVMYPSGDKPDKSHFWNRLYRPVKKLKRKIKKLRKGITRVVFHKTVYRPIDYQEFLAWRIEADNAINWTLRKPHLDVFTDNGRLRKISDIVDFLKDNGNLERIKSQSIVETPTGEVFDEPVNLNEKFWKRGNNFLFYCIYYGFRKGIVPYDQANRYISTVKTPLLYSAQYFEALDIMMDDEIQSLLEANPIICNNGAVTHGKHRVCAMIGRIVSDQRYIPLYAEEQIRRFRRKSGRVRV